MSSKAIARETEKNRDDYLKHPRLRSAAYKQCVGINIIKYLNAMLE